MSRRPSSPRSSSAPPARRSSRVATSVPEISVEWADKALEEAERHDIVPSIVDGLIVKGGALGYLGRGYEGIGTMRGAYALAETHGLQVGMLRAQTNLSDAQI